MCARAEEALVGREKDEYLLLYLELFIAYNMMTKPERAWEYAERSYIPALSALIEMAKNHGDTFKVALSISGVALEQLEVHAPGVIELLHQLNETGCCEFLCEPYSHGLSSLANEDCFREEVERMLTKIKQIFGKEPKVFRNSSLIYSNDIGATIADMGFKGMLTEGAKHILGWKSPVGNAHLAALETNVCWNY